MIAENNEFYGTLDVRATVWNSPAGDAQAGGDWCDVISVADDIIAVTIGDVAGHGEPVAHAARIMLACIRGALGVVPALRTRSAAQTSSHAR